jgi:acylphosphatase
MNAGAARARVVVRGDVQGVKFRASARSQARALGVRGWIRNREDGAVEGVFTGEREAVERLIRWCGRGPPYARVDGVEVDFDGPAEDFDDFSIRR